MAKRSPMATGGEGMGSKPARQGPGGLSPKLKSALKTGGKMAAEELLMTVVPVARIAKLKKVLDGLGKGASRSEVATALKKNGFDKLASIEPDLKSVETFITKRKAKSGRKFSRRGHRSGDPVTRAEQEAMSRLGSGHGYQGDPSGLFKLKLRKAAEAKAKK